MERLVKLSIFSDTYHMERLIVECARNNDMQVNTGRASIGWEHGTFIDRESSGEDRPPDSLRPLRQGSRRVPEG